MVSKKEAALDRAGFLPGLGLTTKEGKEKENDLRLIRV